MVYRPRRWFLQRCDIERTDIVRVSDFKNWNYITDIGNLISFTPSIVASVGYKANRAQLMSVPPFAASIVCKCLDFLSPESMRVYYRASSGYRVVLLR